MNGGPDWQDGECCFRCRTQFTLVARKHHCRNCGNIFCAKCSSQQISLPKLNIEKPVRVCDGCYDKLEAKNEDPLAMALDKSTDPDQVKTPKSASKTSGASKSSSSNKPAANASAPSEQELKEEEELQLALALSLSEAPAKISFPDCRQFEEPQPSSSSNVNSMSNHNDRSNQNKTPSQVSTSTPITSSDLYSFDKQNQKQQQNQAHQQQQHQHQQQQHQLRPDNPNQQQYAIENQMLDCDQDLFKFVADVQSTSEVFMNRINSSKLRNRPIANDSAMQSLFLKLTNMHTKLLEYMKRHEEERAGYESIQDKLSQIVDARAALDDLREEYREKLRQEAAEAEKQRQSQLALKLEMMRQKKSQMMQYQREVALQRIQAQEMMLRQPQGYADQSASMHQQQVPPQHSTVISLPQQQQPTLPQTELQQTPMYQSQNSIIQQPPVVQQQSTMMHQPVFQQNPIQSDRFVPHYPNNQQPVQQFVTPAPKPEDEAPLISFDD